MAHNNAKKKHHANPSPHVEPEEQIIPAVAGVSQNQDDPSRTGHWSANPKDVENEGEMPEAQPDNMPGPTETLTRTNYQRY